MTKWPTCSSDIDGFCNGGELPGMVWVGCMTYFQDHKWYDELVDGKLKEETLMHKDKVAESWGDATPGVMKLYAWLKNSFENFYELDYNVLVKLQECWWKVLENQLLSVSLLICLGKHDCVERIPSGSLEDIPSNPTSAISDETIANPNAQIVGDDMVMVHVPRKVPSFDGPEPQPLLNSPSLDVSLGEERGPEPPIKPYSPDSFMMKEVDHLTNHTPPSPHVASFYPKDMLYLTRRSLEVLRKFHWMILGGRFNQLSHVSSPLLSKPGEY
ncbi:hypothetical protein Tco_0692512 [Tanacetum coccineum]